MTGGRHQILSRKFITDAWRNTASLLLKGIISLSKVWVKAENWMRVLTLALFWAAPAGFWPDSSLVQCVSIEHSIWQKLSYRFGCTNGKRSQKFSHHRAVFSIMILLDQSCHFHPKETPWAVITKIRLGGIILMPTVLSCCFLESHAFVLGRLPHPSTDIKAGFQLLRILPVCSLTAPAASSLPLSVHC